MVLFPFPQNVCILAMLLLYQMYQRATDSMFSRNFMMHEFFLLTILDHKFLYTNSELFQGSFFVVSRRNLFVFYLIFVFFGCFTKQIPRFYRIYLAFSCAFHFLQTLFLGIVWLYCFYFFHHSFAYFSHLDSILF